VKHSLRCRSADVAGVRARLRLRALFRAARGGLRPRRRQGAGQPRVDREGPTHLAISRAAPGPSGEPIDLGTGFTPLSSAQLGRCSASTSLSQERHPEPDRIIKDRNVASHQLRRSYGFDTLSCSSTGNLAGSVAAYAAVPECAPVFIPAGLEPARSAPRAPMRHGRRGQRT